MSETMLGARIWGNKNTWPGGAYSPVGKINKQGDKYATL